MRLYFLHTEMGSDLKREYEKKREYSVRQLHFALTERNKRFAQSPIKMPPCSWKDSLLCERH